MSFSKLFNEAKQNNQNAKEVFKIMVGKMKIYFEVAKYVLACVYLDLINFDSNNTARPSILPKISKKSIICHNL